MWSTIRSMTLDEDEGASMSSSSKRSNSAFAKLKKVMELEGGANSTMDHVMKTLFSSCTNGVPEEDHLQDKAHPTTTAGMTKNPMHYHDAAAATTRQPTTTTGAVGAAATTGPMLLRKENCYAQFLTNDKERAARAVTSLRQHSFEQEQQLNRGVGTMPTGNNVPPSPPTTPNGRVVPRPFHVSTPPRSAQPTSLARTRPQPLLPEELECPQIPVGPDNTNTTTTILMDGVPRTNSMNDHHHHVPTSFDDGISAISAHTLEEMVRQEELQTQQRLGPVRSDLTSEGFDHPVGRNRSTESTLFPPTPSTMNDNEYITIKPSVTSPALRSHGSWKSKGNRSFSTKSTKSSSDFEAVWRKHEQQYWEDVVMEEGDENDGEDDIKQPRRMESTSRMMMSRKNGSFGRTTVGSGQSVRTSLFLHTYMDCRSCRHYVPTTTTLSLTQYSLSLVCTCTFLLFLSTNTHTETQQCDNSN